MSLVKSSKWMQNNPLTVAPYSHFFLPVFHHLWALSKDGSTALTAQHLYYTERRALKTAFTADGDNREVLLQGQKANHWQYNKPLHTIITKVITALAMSLLP